MHSLLYLINSHNELKGRSSVDHQKQDVIFLILISERKYFKEYFGEKPAQNMKPIHISISQVWFFEVSDSLLTEEFV